MSKIAVTGARGYLGSLFCEVAEKVHAVKRFSFGKEFNLPSIIPKMNGLDYCVHFSALTDAKASSEELFSVNAEGTLRLLEKVKEDSPNLKRFIYISTGGVYGFGNTPFVEMDEPNPGNDYAKSKLAGEAHAREFSRAYPVTILRLFYPYGRDQAGVRLLSRLSQRVSNGEPVLLNEGGRPRINPMHVDDLNEGILTAMKANDDRLAVYNLAGSDAVTIKGLAIALGEIIGKKPAFEETNKASLDMVGDISKAREQLNFEPKPLDEGLLQEFKSLAKR